MKPSAAERDEIFKRFARAFFRRDLDALYTVVHPAFVWTLEVGGEVRVLDSRAKIEAFFEERQATQSDVRFDDVEYHHAPQASFMTYRVTGINTASGQAFERVGVERYTFRDGRLAEKDVYSRIA